MADGFLGRWSQRKQAVRQGQALDEPAAKPVPVVAHAPLTDDLLGPTSSTPQSPADSPAPAPPPPSLEDVNSLTAESDFSPFVARAVAPEVRNAAMKKLFADPHYNVMDRLDIYIDDYSKPDPLPESMLRQMASAKFLKLFEDEEDQSQQPQTSAAPPTENTPQAPGTDHDHTDLRLQPNHAAGPQEPGRSTE